LALFRRQGIRLLWTLVIVAALVWVWQLSSLFWLNILSGQTTIHNPVPGIQNVVDWSPPANNNNNIVAGLDNTSGDTTPGGTATTGTGSKPGGTADTGTGATPGGTGDTGTSPKPGGPMDTGTGSVPGATGDEGTDSDFDGTEDEGTDSESVGPDGPVSGGGGGGGGGTTPVVQVVDNDKNILRINTDINYNELFGTLFPGEKVTSKFTIILNIEGIADYTISINSTQNMARYIVVEKDPSEPDTELDPIADGRIGNWTAAGKLTPGTDESDVWLVTFYVPDTAGDYEVNIIVSPWDKLKVAE